MNTYSIIIILLAAILPALAWVVYIYEKDKYRREPLPWLLRGVFYGILSAGIALLLELFIKRMGWGTTEPTTILQAFKNAFISAAIPEECAKLLMLWLLLKRNPYFDERFDGIVYALCIGMGFAGLENIMYLFSNIESWQSIGIGRAIFAIPGHAIDAVAMGFYYALIHFRDLPRFMAVRILWVPVFLHGIYDGILFAINSMPLLAAPLTLCFLIFCWWMFRRGRRFIAQQLERDRRIMQQEAEAEQAAKQETDIPTTTND